MSSASHGTAAVTVPGPRKRARHGDLWFFILKRLGIGLVLIFGVMLVSFILTQLVPGDPGGGQPRPAGGRGSHRGGRVPGQIRTGQATSVQFLNYIWNVLHGDLGLSQQSHRPVSTDLAEYVPATFELAIFAIVLSLVIGVSLGILAAVTRDRWPDQVLRVVSLGGVSMPTFWIALMAFYLLFFKWGLLPGGGRLDPTETPPAHITGMYTVDAVLHGQWALAGSAFYHLMLPGIVLAIFTIGLLLRFTRASVLEILGNDYVRAARAKGLPERVVVLRHVLRPALISIITVAGVAFGSLLSGAVLVENIFSWPGLGQYAYLSAINLDLPAIMGVSLVVAIVYIVMNLLVDVLYGVIDPRIRLS